MNWKPITQAPMDGSPIWVRGWDYGKEGTTRHCCWAYWNGVNWIAAGPDGAVLQFLTHFATTGAPHE
jgi:hypothetical protein